MLANKTALEEAQFQLRVWHGLGGKPWTFEDEATAALLAKLGWNSVRLLDLPACMSRGSSTGDDEVFVIGMNSIPLEPEALRVPLFASDFGRYHFEPSGLRGRLCPMASGGFTITLGSPAKVRAEYVLGLLNSKLLFWRLQKASNCFVADGSFAPSSILANSQFELLISPTSPIAIRHNQIVKLVEKMVEFNEGLSAAKTPQEKISLERQMAAARRPN